MRVFFKIGTSWREAETDQKSIIEQNVVHDNLENPTNYVSEHAYSLVLPRTPHNNKLFNNFAHLDALLIAGGYTPAAKMDFRADGSDGSPVMQGTATITRITPKDYQLSLIGSLGMVFQRLLNAGWDTSRVGDGSGYFLMEDWLKKTKGVRSYPTPGGQTEAAAHFTEAANTINKAFVFASWLIDTPIFNWNTLKSTAEISPGSGVTETAAFIANIVGWAPTSQGQPEGFETTKWVKNCTFVENGVLTPNVLSTDKTAITEFGLDTVNIQSESSGYEAIKKGLIEAQVGEYRCYNQQPYIYVFRLWQLFQSESAQITGGYTLNLDSRWFNANNPQLANVVYMLPKESATLNTKGGAYKEGYNGQAVSISTPNQYGGTTGTNLDNGLQSRNATWTSYAVPAEQYGDGFASVQYAFEFRLVATGSSDAVIEYKPYNFIMLELWLENGTPGQAGARVIAQRRLVVLPTADGDLSGYEVNAIVKNSLHNALAGVGSLYNNSFNPEAIAAQYTPQSREIKFVVTGQMTGLVADSSQQLFLYAKANFCLNHVPIDYSSTNHPNSLLMQFAPVHSAVKFSWGDNNHQHPVSLENLFKDTNPFGVLLKYSKMTALTWEIDETTNTINVLRRADYFADKRAQGITDITPCVDISKLEIQPISWQSHSVEFNFEDTEPLSRYKDTYGLTYGSKRIITTNSLNTSNKTLLGNNDYDKIKASAKTTELAVKLSSILNGVTAITVYTESLPKPINESDGKSANLFGNFYVRHTNRPLTDSALLDGWRTFYVRNTNRPVTDSALLDGWRTYATITEDDPLEIREGVYCWHGNDDGKHIYTIPNFDICDRAKAVALQFAAPREVYHADIYPADMVYLYEANWQHYIEEVYNAENKTVTAEAVITRTMYNRLKLNPLCRVDNIVYLLCKIEGWSDIDGRCKITIRQISDLNNLTYKPTNLQT